MNVIRDIFSILFILCVLCLQFDSVQVQASENDQKRGTPHGEPHTSSSVKASKLQERKSNLSVTLTTAKNELDRRKQIMRKKKSKKLHNQLKEFIFKANPNTLRRDIEERAESARKSEAEEQEKPSGEVGVDTTTKNSEKSGESTRKRKSQELLNQDEESQISNEDWKEIAEKKNNEIDQESRKQLRDKTDKVRSSNILRQHEKGGQSSIIMRQQEKGGDDNIDDEEDPEMEVINIYSLQQDMIRMLGSISNINASVGVIGRTAEYNDIVLCKITEYSKTEKPIKVRAKAEDDKYTDEETEKKIIFIVHGLSAMGFKTVPCLYQEKEFIKLVKFYTEHLDKFDIYLIPFANPDGVINQEKIPNKNNSPQSACSGVALDRNFDISWNTFHVNSCHQQYPGPYAFSEPEARAVGDILHHYNNRIAAYINVHAASYSAEVFKGDAVLYPKGFAEFNSDDDKYMDIKGEIDEALRIAGFKVMSVTVDTLYNWYGKVSGTSVDYASSVYGIPYAMEFVMQSYEDIPSAASTEKTSENVLTEVWKRVIDVVFTNIHRSNQNNEVNK